MLLNEFLKAAVPNPVTCLGARLRPFSLGAFFLLQRFDNSFLKFQELSPEQSQFLPTGDLLQGVIACSLPFAEAQASLSDPDLLKELADWSKRLFKRRIFARVAPQLEKEARLRDAKQIFHGYLKAGLAYPCTRAECGPARPVGSPWPLLTLTGLMAELHQDFHTAVDQSLPLSRWLIAGNGERRGLLEVCERGELADLQKEADAIAREEFGESATAHQGGA